MAVDSRFFRINSRFMLQAVQGAGESPCPCSDRAEVMSGLPQFVFRQKQPVNAARKRFRGIVEDFADAECRRCIAAFQNFPEAPEVALNAPGRFVGRFGGEHLVRAPVHDRFPGNPDLFFRSRRVIAASVESQENGGGRFAVFRQVKKQIESLVFSVVFTVNPDFPADRKTVERCRIFRETFKMHPFRARRHPAVHFLQEEPQDGIPAEVHPLERGLNCFSVRYSQWRGKIERRDMVFFRIVDSVIRSV